MKFLLRLAYVATTSMPLLLRPYNVLTTPWLDHVLTTLFWTCSKFYHVLRVHEDITTLLSFLLRFLLRLTGSYCVHLIVEGHSRTWLSAKGYLPHLLHVAAKAQTNIRICAVLPEPSLFVYTQNMDLDKTQTKWAETWDFQQCGIWLWFGWYVGVFSDPSEMKRL